MISLIFANDPNHLIGKDNDLPWYYPEDLKYFKNMTLNKTVLMGKNTFLSIVNRLGHPLPNRKNIVVTRKGIDYPDIEVVNDLVGFLKKPTEEEIFVIGGKAIYEVAFPYANRLYITHIKKKHIGNVFLDYSLDGFKKISELDTENAVFAIYERE